jgi:hypothetical protein
MLLASPVHRTVNRMEEAARALWRGAFGFSTGGVLMHGINSHRRLLGLVTGTSECLPFLIQSYPDFEPVCQPTPPPVRRPRPSYTSASPRPSEPSVWPTDRRDVGGKLGGAWAGRPVQNQDYQESTGARAPVRPHELAETWPGPEPLFSWRQSRQLEAEAWSPGPAGPHDRLGTGVGRAARGRRAARP